MAKKRRSRRNKLRATFIPWYEPPKTWDGKQIVIKARRSRDYFDVPIEVQTEPFIEKTTPIFTIGSCFALEIKRRLIDAGYNVIGHDQNKYELIWYNTFSIRDEAQRLLGIFTQDFDDVWYLDSGRHQGRWQDPFRRMVFAKTQRRLWRRIHSIDAVIREGLTKSKVVIITLGLTEVWFDEKTGHALCTSPGYYDGGGVGTSVFRATGFGENFANMVSFLTILKTVNPTARVIVTVSPVPIGVTFRKMDHCIANMESKSILRAVAGKLVSDFPSVEYFHSYELAMCSFGSGSVYKRDGRHVDPAMVDRIVAEFTRHFIRDSF